MPAAAFAQVVTFLVSNHLGAKNSTAARTTIIKILFLTSILVSSALIILNIWAPSCIAFLAPTPELIAFATPLLRLLSCLVVFDFIQLILAGALRGAGKVKTVMWIRFISCLFFFLPISYILSLYSFSSISVQFFLIYGAFYCNTALMGAAFLFQLRQKYWYEKTV